jgi:hypothetical protein
MMTHDPIEYEWEVRVTDPADIMEEPVRTETWTRDLSGPLPGGA